MAAQNQGLGVDQFDAYFRRADLDHDGRISGAEAVSFFQGSGLSKQVLAQIWMHADQSRTGFLSRQEFYNALKLITVAQSKRDLTPDIVKAALYGPASSKIPPPQINVPPAPAGQLASLAPTAQMAPTAPTVPQTLGPRGPVPPSNSMSQLHYPAQGNPLMRPPSVTQVTPVSTASRPPQSTPVLPNPGISTDWLSGRAGGFTAGPTPQVSNRGASPLVSAPLPKTQDLQPASSHSIAKDSKASVSGNGFASNSSFGGDLFSALVPKQNSSSTTSSAVVSSALVPSSPLPQSSSMQSSLQPLQNAFTKQPTGSQLMQSQTLTNKPQQPQTSFNLSQAVSHASSGVVSPANSSGLGNSAPSQSQAPWPKMTAAGIQKYTKLFMDVDTDRDGKITGEQARNLFLSWKLPREVLKQVWDLAEQDNDSMLSLREFCIALYLMERHREGRTLPASLPNSIMFDETLMRMAGLPNSNYNNTAAGVAPGFRQVQGAPGSQQMPSAGAVRPPVPVATHHAEGMRQFNQDRSSLLQRENFQANQLSHIDQHAVQSDSQEAVDAEKKVEKVEKIILDSREKLEYYRTKMQDLVLYKSRCDNRLNEIIERASSDKREAEMVGKKYEEKYKQVAELASKLTIEEATFREYQERKMELHQAIINMEQGGSADGILQVRADRTQSELEELMKALAERCKKHGIEIKSVAMIELPQGWQPGIPEEAAVWNEEWDKFEDEGLLFDKDPKADAQNGTTVSKSASFLDNMYPIDDGYSPDSMSNTDVKSEKHSSRSEHVLDSESGYAHSEDGSARSPQDSPHPASEFSDVFAKTSEADSDFHRGFDDQGWGTFDGNDDVDSVWGFNANSKDSGHDRDGVFESGSFGLSPLRTGSDSPQARGNFNNKSSVFADSVPGTPFSKSANSPRYSEAGDGFFNSYSGFNSFSNQDTRFSPPRETFTRFDSISSSRDESTFGRFDSMNSSRGEAFGRFDSMSSSRVDSMSSSRGFEHSRGFNSFDDADPFGSSGPFQVSSESKTPKKSSDSWSSF